jgi:hypothetical protein
LIETDEELSESADQAREFAWKHFDFHAKQRIDMFKSYLTLLAILYAAFGLSIQTKGYLLGIVFAVISILFSTIFYLLDIRNRQLIIIAERFLIKEELRLALRISDHDIRLFRKSDLVTKIGRPSIRLSYSNLFRLFFGLNILAAIALLLIFIAYLS